MRRALQFAVTHDDMTADNCDHGPAFNLAPVIWRPAAFGLLLGVGDGFDLIHVYDGKVAVISLCDTAFGGNLVDAVRAFTISLVLAVVVLVHR